MTLTFRVNMDLVIVKCSILLAATTGTSVIRVTLVVNAKKQVLCRKASLLVAAFRTVGSLQSLFDSLIKLILSLCTVKIIVPVLLVLKLLCRKLVEPNPIDIVKSGVIRVWMVPTIETNKCT